MYVSDGLAGCMWVAYFDWRLGLYYIISYHSLFLCCYCFFGVCYTSLGCVVLGWVCWMLESSINIDDNYLYTIHMDTFLSRPPNAVP